jgi:phosphatidylinositol alpha-1,6-mannosyltransferase
MAPTMIITNDFPPTVGGIEGFVADICGLLDNDVIVLTRHTPGWQDHDHQLPYQVIRHGRLLLPTPDVLHLATRLITRRTITRVVFGAMAPLALLAPRLRATGVQRMVAVSHGHEIWWATLPASSALLARMADAVDHVSTISDYTARRIGPALSPAARQRMIRISPPVDTTRFRPADDQTSRPPTVIATGRMVRQKGFDTLLRAWALRQDDHARLIMVGDGPQAAALRRLARRLKVSDSVQFTGRMPREQIPDLLRQADAYALPVRSRLGGLNPEGLGLGFLEAAASGLPVVVGRSGGAPETVIDGTTGYVVDPDDPHQLAARIDALTTDPTQAAAMGRAGRDYVCNRYGAHVVRSTLCAALGLDD